MASKEETQREIAEEKTAVPRREPKNPKGEYNFDTGIKVPKEYGSPAPDIAGQYRKELIQAQPYLNMEEGQCLYKTERKQKTTLDKVKGSVLGFAIGDALGSPGEFSKNPHYLSGFESSPRKGLQAGQYTDDTQHLEVGLDSLIVYNGKINFQDHADRLIRWYKSGGARSIGRTTELAIKNLMEGVDYSKSGINHINYCGSSAIARLVPYSLLSAVSRYPHKLFRSDIKKILGITHAHRKVLAMGELYNYLIQEVANGKTPGEAINMLLFEDVFLNRRVRDKIKKVKDLSESSESPGETIQKIGDSGFVEDVIFSSIYGALKGSSFKEAVLISANGGGDSDSRAALTGTLCGLDIGASQIPVDLRTQLERNSELEKKAEEIYFLRK